MPSTNERMPSPSASAAPRIMFVRTAPAASGLRPIASDDFAVRMPMPRPGPMTPRPTARPAARPLKSTDVFLLLLFATRRRLRDAVLRVRHGRCRCDSPPRVIVMGFDREHEVHEHQEGEHEALHQPDEHLEPDEREREPRHEEQRAHDGEHDLAAEDVAPETERQREHPEDLAEELDEPDKDEDGADERTVLEAAEVEPPLQVAEAEVAEALALVRDPRHERHRERDVVVGGR